MKRTTRLAAALAVVVASVALAGPPATAEPHADAVVDPLPRIAAGPGRDLVNTETGEQFQPRGFNYVRLTPSPSRPDAHYQSAFEPGQYDAARADTMLADLTVRGYDTVRVFVDPGDGRDNELGRPHGLGHGNADLSPANAAYLDNLADFVRRAASYGIYVLPSLDTFPQNGYYRDIIVNSPQPVNIAGRNLSFLYEGYIRAKEEYLRVFTTEMQARLGDLMSTFLALQLANEAYLYHTDAPFHQYSGTVTVAGRSYDMAVPAQRQAAADDGFVAYANRGVAAVKAVDPELMVTMGAFTNLAVNGKAFDGLSGLCGGKPCNEPRYPVRVSTVTRESDLDFFDIHLYLMTGRTLAASLGSMEWSQVIGPVINGEYGSQRKWFGNDIQQARTALVAHQVGTCEYGISGWLYWTWDTTEEVTQQSFFNGIESGGLLGAALSPRNRPDPCSTTEVRVRHLTVSPLAAAELQGPRPQFSGGGPGGTLTLTVNGQEVGRAEASAWRWFLRPTADLPVGEPFDAVFRLYRDGRLADIVTVPDIVLGP